MESKSVAPIELVGPDNQLTVRFFWNGDRFAHELICRGQSIASSIDGDAENAWPPSPPIQQLSLESIDGKDVVLGVGAAGRGHWSISVQFTANSTVKFELACRGKEPPQFLGSSYRLESQVSLAPADELTEIDGSCAKFSALDESHETKQWAYFVAVNN
ncbi:MAG: hypothetical protein AB8B91_11560 [Rubripirellula sp.]